MMTDDQYIRVATARWVAYLVKTCSTYEADMVASALGLKYGYGDLQAIAKKMVEDMIRRAEDGC